MASIDLREPTDVSEVASSIWGGGAKTVTQQHGVPGFRADWYQYSSGLGWPGGYHMGLDISMPRGTPLRSNVYGEVIQAGWSDSYRPNPVTIVTEDDPATRDVNEAGAKIIYGHLWENAVKVGDRVRPRDLIGYSGEQTVLGTMQPDGSGAHLHYETRMSSPEATTGEFGVNPLPFLYSRLPAGDALTGDGARIPIPDLPGEDDGGGCGLTDWKCWLAKGVSGGVDVATAPMRLVAGVMSALTDLVPRAGVFLLGLLFVAIGVARVLGIGAGDVANVVPVARAAKVAKSLKRRK